MNKAKIFLILSILGILLLLILSQTLDNNKLTGKITKINRYANSIVISLENSPIQIILFTDKKINLTSNNTIEVQGKLEKYKNQTQLIADKVILK